MAKHTRGINTAKLRNGIAVVEFGNLSRFDEPRQLMAYRVSSERSTAERQARFDRHGRQRAWLACAGEGRMDITASAAYRMRSVPNIPVSNGVELLTRIGVEELTTL